jgi:hypothetical protein
MARVTDTKFSAQTVRVASGNKLDARINFTGNTVKANVTFRDGRAESQMTYTFYSEEQMQAGLKKLDPSVKFLNKTIKDTEPIGDHRETRLSQDDTMLENLRIDPNTKDVLYFNACRRLGQKPKPRPDFTGTNSTQQIIGLPAQIEQLRKFGQAHPEMNYGVFGAYNYELIQAWMENENRQYTAENLEQAHSELTAAGCFKSFDTGRPGGRITQPYNHAALVAARKQRAAVVEPPAGLGEADLQAWKFVHASKPELDVRSDAFRVAVSRQLQDWARFRAIETDATLQEPSKEGELRRAIDGILLGWARQSNAKIGLGNKGAAIDRRVWLG